MRRWQRPAGIPGLLVAILLSGPLLIGCGGGGDDGAAATPPSRTFSLLHADAGRVQPLGGRRYRLTLADPRGVVALLRDRPFRTTGEQSLRAWVDDWDRNGFAADPPSAALSLAAASGEPGDLVVAELSNPGLTADGALAFDARFLDVAGRSQALFPDGAFATATVFVDDESDDPHDRSAGVFVVAGSSGTLIRQDGGYRLTMRGIAEVVGFAPAPLQAAVRESGAAWVREWAARGFDTDPPNAALAVSADGMASGTRWALVELSHPALLDDGALQLSLRVLSSPPAGALPEGPVGASQLFVDSAPLLAGDGCRTSHDCGGSATCDDRGACQLLACRDAGDCGDGEACDSGRCAVVTACRGAADCPAARICDGEHCRLKACATTADCSAAETCSGQVCAAPAPGAAPASDLRHVAGPGALWGATWSTPNLESNCAQQPAALQPLCQLFEQAGEDVVRNVVATLAAGGEPYTYYGRSAFFAVDEQDPIPAHFRGEYFYPPAGLQNALLQPFAIFDSAFMNYSTRLGEPLVGQQVLTPFAGRLPASPIDFIDGIYATLLSNLQDEGFPDSFVVPETDPLALSKQLGGGGGFGCYIGAYAADGQTLLAPAVQFGGGFGFGVSEADGLDIGFGGGINLCTAQSATTCVEDAVDFFGGGAGVNRDLATGAELRDNDTDGDEAAFDASVAGSVGPGLLGASRLYVSCGSGGGLGFQSLPAAAAAPRVYAQTYGMGGGGYVFAVIDRVAAAAVPSRNVLTGVDLDAFNEQLGQLHRLLTTAPAGAPPAPVGGAAAAQRGLYAADGTRRFSGSVANLGFVYEPYRFPIADPAMATADTAYIPGSTSPASLFFTSWDAQADASLVAGAAIPRLLYTLNLNPVDVQYRAGGTAAVRDINDGVLQALQPTGARVLLAIPLFVQHDSDGTSQQAPLVSANQELLDYALAAAATYANVDGIVVGTDAHPVIKGFSASCNDYNDTTPQLATTCGGYADAVTFEDYYDLLAYLFDGLARSGVPRALTLGISQSEANWFENSTISNNPSDPYPLRLIDYWSLPSGTPNTGLTKFITDLSSPAVTLQPIVSIDLVAAYTGQPLATATAYLGTVLDELIRNIPAVSVQTGWFGEEIGAFLADPVVARIQQLGYGLFVDELFDQPWKALPAALPGMPGTTCGHMYPVPPLDPMDPQGPPLPQQLPTECAPDFGNVVPGGQPQPPCLCLVNSTDYPATFFPFLSDVTTPADSQPTLNVPRWRAATYDKGAGDPNSFYNRAVANKDGAYSLGVTWQQWPYSQTYTHPGEPPNAGDAVPAPAAGTLIPSLVCAGVSDAQNGAASANAAFPCDQVWFQSASASLGSDDCVTLAWTAKGSGYRRVTGWELQALEAPPPQPGQPAQTYQPAPLVVIPAQEQAFDDADQEVSVRFTYCGGSFPTGLDPGTYWFRVQPISGIPSVDGIDIELDPLTVPPGGTTDWQTLGKFTVDYPINADGSSPIASLVFTLPPPGAAAAKSFTLFAPQDNGISDITLPGKPQGSTAGDDAATTTLTVTFDPPLTTAAGATLAVCTIELIVTAGMNAGDQDGEAVLRNGPIEPDRPEDACYLELQNDLKTVNGSSFQFTLP